MNPAMVNAALNEAMQIDGVLGVALVDHSSGLTLGTAGGGNGFNLEIAAAGKTEVVKSEMKVMGQLGLRDRIEDILITLGNHYHLIRMVGGSNNLFLYLALHKDRSNLGLARHQLMAAEQKLA